MAMTKKAALKKGFVKTKIEVEVYIDPDTGNVMFPCADDPYVYDRYAILIDPDPNAVGSPVKMVCNKHKRKYQRNSIPVTLAALLEAGAKVYLDGQWQKLTQKLAKKYEWFPAPEEEEEENEE